MNLEIGDAELFKQYIAPYLPSRDFYELRSRFDNLREFLPLIRHLKWPVVVQEILNPDITIDEAIFLSRSLRIETRKDPDSLKTCLSVLHSFFQNETCADCVKRSFLTLSVIYATLIEIGLSRGSVEDLMESSTSSIALVALYCEDCELLEKTVRISGISKDRDNFIAFSRECYTACVIFDRLDFFKELQRQELIAPVRELGQSVDIFTTVMNPLGLAGIAEAVPNNPFVPKEFKRWFDFIIDDLRISWPACIWGLIVEYGSVEVAKYFVEDRRALISTLYVLDSSFQELLDFARSYRDHNPSVAEYFESSPYSHMGNVSVESACAFDEIQLVKRLLVNANAQDVNFDSCYTALGSPLFTLERRNTEKIRSLLDAKKMTLQTKSDIHKKRSKRYCCY